jgi:capsular polysaccharide biosynthesis protein/Tfp pilus assembly protein PilF
VVRAGLAAATAYLEGARPDLALAAAERVLAVDPLNARALGVMGLVAQVHDRLDLAAGMFLRGIEGAPRDPAGYRRMSALLLQDDRPDEAVALLAQAAHFAPADYGTHVDLAAANLAAGHLDEAADALRAAISIDPGPTDPRVRLVALDLAAGRAEAAIATYRGLLESDGQDPAGHLVVIGRLRGVRDWCTEHLAPYRPLAAARPATIQRPRYLDDGGPPGSVTVTRPETYLAEVPDATVIGGETVVLTSSGDLLLDLATHPDAGRFDLAEGVLRWAEQGAALLDAQVASDEPIEAAIHLAGVSSGNYFHWLLEFLPRIACLEAGGTGTDVATLPLLVDRAVHQVPQLVEALTAVDGGGRRLIVLEPGRARRVRRLVVPSQLAWLPNNLRDGLELRAEDSHISEEAIRFLRDRLLPSDARPSRPARRRIHLARPQSRRLLNASELDPVLAEFDIESVQPELLSLADQVRLFADADLIVAESGAALTNIVFAPPSARIVVLSAGHWDQTLFSQIAAVIGQSMTYVAGTLIPGSHRKIYQSSFTLAPDVLRQALEQVLR